MASLASRSCLYSSIITAIGLKHLISLIYLTIWQGLCYAGTRAAVWPDDELGVKPVFYHDLNKSGGVTGNTKLYGQQISSV